MSLSSGPFFPATAPVLGPYRLGLISRGLSAALAEILGRIRLCDRPVPLTLLALVVQVAAVLQSQLARPRSA